MFKLDTDLEDIPGHREFFKFFKAILILSFNKREEAIFFRGKKDLKQSLNLQILLCQVFFDMESF